LAPGKPVEISEDIDKSLVAANAHLSDFLAGMTVDSAHQPLEEKAPSDVKGKGKEAVRELDETAGSKTVEDAAAPPKPEADQTKDKAKNFSRPFQPLNIDMSSKPPSRLSLTKTPKLTAIVPPHRDNWNLAGHDPNDPKHNIITEDAWYNFAKNQAAKGEEERKKKDGNVHRLLKEDGGYKEE
jgi:hypothetical protein